MSLASLAVCMDSIVQTGDNQSKPSKQCGQELHSSSFTFAVHDGEKAVKKSNAGLQVD